MDKGLLNEVLDLLLIKVGGRRCKKKFRYIVTLQSPESVAKHSIITVKIRTSEFHLIKVFEWAAKSCHILNLSGAKICAANVIPLANVARLGSAKEWKVMLQI